MYIIYTRMAPLSNGEVVCVVMTCCVCVCRYQFIQCVELLWQYR